MSSVTAATLEALSPCLSALLLSSFERSVAIAFPLSAAAIFAAATAISASSSSIAAAAAAAATPSSTSATALTTSNMAQINGDDEGGELGGGKTGVGSERVGNEGEKHGMLLISGRDDGGEDSDYNKNTHNNKDTSHPVPSSSSPLHHSLSESAYLNRNTSLARAHSGRVSHVTARNKGGFSRPSATGPFSSSPPPPLPPTVLIQGLRALAAFGETPPEIRHLGWPVTECAFLERVLTAARYLGHAVESWETASVLLREHFTSLPPWKIALLMDTLVHSGATFPLSERVRWGAGPGPGAVRVRRLLPPPRPLRPVPVRIPL
eukprot:CAMPEP_0175061378 /NCGR_PEP_ID=MMETSP0052_2-20121109/13548_1 /TAXON_ID=51329 ORGANISM="Polytomella parva, Strain SAG 63-3" /NCGR_SAMPLE_ID=MMETSP0052_2 /ASSEMBLY_ACC=CAM_ASM_000194 /LENGTH=320 /DNA_ID=CAMNT_0016327219 /DNA_START=261 /DNA_END=1220 /DNA_ORIENTATION=+